MVIKKISREEAENVLKKHFGLKRFIELKYCRDNGYEGYGSALVDYEFIEGEVIEE